MEKTEGFPGLLKAAVVPAAAPRAFGRACPALGGATAGGAVAAALLAVLALAGCLTRTDPYPGRKLQEALDAFNEGYTIVWGHPFDLAIPTHLPEEDLRRAAGLFDQAARQSRETLDYYFQAKDAYEEVHGFGTATWKAAPVASSLERLSSYLAGYVGDALRVHEAAHQREAGGPRRRAEDGWSRVRVSAAP